MGTEKNGGTEAGANENEDIAVEFGISLLGRLENEGISKDY